MAILKHCCCCFSLRTGSLILGICSLIGCIIGIVAMCVVLPVFKDIANNIRRDPPEGVYDVEEYISFIHGLAITLLVMCILGLLETILLIHGIRTEHPKMMMPFIIVSAIGLIIGVILGIVMMARGGDLISSIITICVDTPLGIYFLIVIYSHYQELKEGQEVGTTPVTTA